ncbi:MAG: hypothetical protein AAGA56_07930 [Myxococcota bacterium]
MATLVIDRATGARFVLLGTGYGAYASSTPGAFLGALSNDERAGAHSVVAVSGPNGQIAWCPSDSVLVASVDGRAPAELLQGPGLGGTIARDFTTGAMLVVMGTGFGAFASATPSMFWGNHKPKRQEGHLAMVAVADAAGHIWWAPSEVIQIVQVDGQPLDAWLG